MNFLSQYKLVQKILKRHYFYIKTIDFHLLQKKFKTFNTRMALYSVVALGNTDDSDPCGYSPSPHSLLLPQAISIWSNETSSSSEMKSFQMYIALHLIIAVLSTIGNCFVIASVIFINSADR